jgi:hypothetical protein
LQGIWATHRDMVEPAACQTAIRPPFA